MMLKIKEMLPLERPREKLQLLGAQALTDKELLAVLLGSGGKGQPVFQMCDDLLNLVSIRDLPDTGLEELCVAKGIGVVRGLMLMAVVELSKRMRTEPLLRLVNQEAMMRHCQPILAAGDGLSYLLVLMNADRELLAVADMGCVLPDLARVLRLVSESGAQRLQLVRNGWLLFSRAERDFMDELELACGPLRMICYELMAVNGDQFRTL